MKYFVQILFCRLKQNITTNAIQFDYSRLCLRKYFNAFKVFDDLDGLDPSLYKGALALIIRM